MMDNAWNWRTLLTGSEDLHSRRLIWDLQIDPVGRLFKLVHSGTSLGTIVAEVYFGCCAERRKIYVCGVFQSSSTDEAPWYRLVRMENRFEHYLRIDK